MMNLFPCGSIASPRSNPKNPKLVALLKSTTRVFSPFSSTARTRRRPTLTAAGPPSLTESHPLDHDSNSLGRTDVKVRHLQSSCALPNVPSDRFQARFFGALSGKLQLLQKIRALYTAMGSGAALEKNEVARKISRFSSGLVSSDTLRRIPTVAFLSFLY